MLAGRIALQYGAGSFPGHVSIRMTPAAGITASRASPQASAGLPVPAQRRGIP
jgi:hypothetical protein